MKKVISLFLSTTLMLPLAACNNKPNVSGPNSRAKVQVQPEADASREEIIAWLQDHSSKAIQLEAEVARFDALQKELEAKLSVTQDKYDMVFDEADAVAFWSLFGAPALGTGTAFIVSEFHRTAVEDRLRRQIFESPEATAAGNAAKKAKLKAWHMELVNRINGLGVDGLRDAVATQSIQQVRLSRSGKKQVLEGIRNAQEAGRPRGTVGLAGLKKLVEDAKPASARIRAQVNNMIPGSTSAIWDNAKKDLPRIKQAAFNDGRHAYLNSRVNEIITESQKAGAKTFKTGLVLVGVGLVAGVVVLVDHDLKISATRAELFRLVEAVKVARQTTQAALAEKDSFIEAAIEVLQEQGMDIRQMDALPEPLQVIVEEVQQAMLQEQVEATEITEE